MTVTYSLDVGSTKLGGFAKLLLRWRGSIYKLMYREMLIFVLLYYIVMVIRRFALSESQTKEFKKISKYCMEFTGLIPITFVMGFYVAVVVGRWWQIFLNLPWPDRTLLNVSIFIQGRDERGRMIRRSLARYMNLSAILTLQATSITVKKRFPTLDHVFDAGIITEEERNVILETVAPHGNWWVPFTWFGSLAMEARKEGRIHDDLHLKSIIDEMLLYRGCLGMIWSYDWISVPLVYTQVVTLAVYSFFAACLFGRQYHIVDDENTLTEQYVPVFTLFQFFFYVGWLKVAEQLINPLGEDDDDFDLNWIIDRNIQVGYSIVDDLHLKHPRLNKDVHWNIIDFELPYTTGAAEYKTEPFLGSVMDVDIKLEDTNWNNNMGTITEEPDAVPNQARSMEDGLKTGIFSVSNEGTPVVQRRGRFHRLLSGNSRQSLHRSSSKPSINSRISRSKNGFTPPSAPSRQKSSAYSRASSVQSNHEKDILLSAFLQQLQMDSESLPGSHTLMNVDRPMLSRPYSVVDRNSEIVQSLTPSASVVTNVAFSPKQDLMDPTSKMSTPIIQTTLNGFQTNIKSDPAAEEQGHPDVELQPATPTDPPAASDTVSEMDIRGKLGDFQPTALAPLPEYVRSMAQVFAQTSEDETDNSRLDSELLKIPSGSQYEMIDTDSSRLSTIPERLSPDHRTSSHADVSEESGGSSPNPVLPLQNGDFSHVLKTDNGLCRSGSKELLLPLTPAVCNETDILSRPNDINCH